MNIMLRDESSISTLSIESPGIMTALGMFIEQYLGKIDAKGKKKSQIPDWSYMYNNLMNNLFDMWVQEVEEPYGNKHAMVLSSDIC